MTAYGGFSLLASFFEKIKLKEQIEQIIPIKETSPNGTGIYIKILSYALIMFAGGERFSHVLYLGSRKVLSELFGVKRLIKAGTSITRMFNKIQKMSESEKASEGIWKYLEPIIEWGKIKEDWLNFDSTVLERYGQQEGAKVGYNPQKKGRPSHNPLIGFLNQSKYVVSIWNRQGNVASCNNICAFFSMSYQRVKDRIKILGIIADSGFYNRKLIEIIEEKMLVYIIAVRLYHPLQRKIYAQKEWKKTAEGIEVCEFEFAHKDWGKPRRYVAVRQSLNRRPKAMGKQLRLFDDEQTKNYRYSVWITNSKKESIEVWEQCKPRANDENIIKELKEDFALGGFCLKKFYATEVAMFIRVLIYNLFVLFRDVIMDGKEQTQRLKTLRYKYFVIPGQLGRSGRDKILRLSMHSNKLKRKMKTLYHRITQYVGLNMTYCNAFGNCF